MQVTIQSIPASLQEFETLAAAGRQPERICALFLCALALFDKDRDAGTAAMNLLRGPRPMTPYDCQFLRDRLRGKAYLPLAYFEGATPENGYTAHTIPAERAGRPQAAGHRAGVSARVPENGGRRFAAAHEAAAEGINRRVVPLGVFQHSQRHPYSCGGRPVGIVNRERENRQWDS